MKNSKEARKVREMIEDIRVCMLVSEDEHGHLRSRPMHYVEVDEDMNVWFFTNKYSGKVEEVQEEMQVNLAFSDKDENDYLSISGRASVVMDKAKIDKLWSPAMKIWFPEGKDSEKIALLCIKPVHAEYWDSSSSKLVQLFKMGKAYMTGEQYQGKDSGQVVLN